MEDGSNSSVAEVSSCDHNDPKMTSDDILSVKHLNSTSLVSVEGIQNLVGGTDIKVYWYLQWHGYVNMTIQFTSVLHFFTICLICLHL